MIVVDCEQNSPEWLAARLGLATASAFGDILAKGKGVTRSKYLARLVVERLSGRPIGGGFTSKATEQGHEREPEGLALYEARTGVFTQRVGFVRHDEILAGASPDALVGGDGCVEAKCPEVLAHLEYLDLPPGCAPSVYVPQVQGEMWICERRWCDFISYSPDFPGRHQLVIRRVMRDQAYIDMLSAEVRVFLGAVDERVRELA